MRESSLNAPKALLKKSSCSFSASFFSFTVDGTEFTLVLVFHGLMESARRQLPKLVVGMLLGSPFILSKQIGALCCFSNQTPLPLALKKFPQMRSLWSDRYGNCLRELRN